MTNEEINELIQELAEEIEKLSDPEKPLTKAEKKHKNMLLLKLETLEKLMEAREKGKSGREYSLTVTYGLLTSLGEKCSFLIPFIKGKSSIGI